MLFSNTKEKLSSPPPTPPPPIPHYPPPTVTTAHRQTIVMQLTYKHSANVAALSLCSERQGASQGGPREPGEGAAPCAPCRPPCTSCRPPRAPTAGLTCPGCGETSLGSVYCILIILDDFSLRFNDFDKYAVTKR